MGDIPKRNYFIITKNRKRKIKAEVEKRFIRYDAYWFRPDAWMIRIEFL